MSDTFPRQYARTQRLSLGEPRSFTVAPDGSRVIFIRSHSGSDAVNTLWSLDTATGIERELLDPRTLNTDLSELTAAELRQRERAREGASGVTSYACNRDVSLAVTVLGGSVVLIDLLNGDTKMLAIEPGVFDVRLSPDGTTISYLRETSLCISSLAGNERVLASDPSEAISWGNAEFIAAEEMGRFRGYWWSPDSQSIAACRVDVSSINVWHIADPAHPELPATEHRYPAAGTPNASVSLHIISVATATATPVELSGNWEYLNTVSWNSAGLIAQTQTRNQKQIDIHSIDPGTGKAAIVFTDTDEAWVELVPGVPAIQQDGIIVTCADRDGSRRLLVNGSAVTPTTMQVRSVVSVGDSIMFMANEITTPWQLDAWAYRNGLLEQITQSHGVVSVSGSRSCYVSRISTLDTERAQFAVHTPTATHNITSLTETSLVQPNVRIMSVGPRGIPVAILLPRDGLSTKLPVLFDPYGGPHAQRVVASRAAYNSSQWFADQGFVVVIVDNTGTPGKGSVWERGVMHDLAQPVLDDQVEILRDLNDLEPRADTSRVGIRGWSFGGYLAALAVLRRSDLFHAAVAGAPVTDWRLYDTHYTERYLGNPAIDGSAYEATSLFNDAEHLQQPLLLIHGLADDNVVAAHTLQLSSALLAAGKPHEVLPLSGVTHMTPQEVVAENLLLHQLEFLQRHLC
ncbi:MAG: prolyl oligopeptidase family serine peptidase [Ilumatobacteraceae bacterium]|nr:prolyl oligopeptidase family serine peptidase [Ilumatobacteraceae bacterium]